MPKRTILEIDELQAIEAKRKKNKDKNIENRLLVLVLHANGANRKEISQKTGFVVSYISELLSKYKRIGLEKYSMKHHKGNRRNLSFDDEAKLLQSFEAKAELGQIIHVSEIKAEYEKQIGRKLRSKGHIYSILKRHKWRKVKPRSRHPKKASEEVINASKKLT